MSRPAEQAPDPKGERGAGDSDPRPEVIQAVDFEPTDRKKKLRKRRIRFGTILACAVLAPLLAGVWYVFSAKSVRVQVTPAADTIEVLDRPLHVALQERYLMLPGEVTFRVTKSGYYDLTETVTVSKASSQEFNLLLVKLPGMLDVKLEPAVAAELTIDDAAPLPLPDVAFELAAGTHELLIEAPRYQPARRTVDIEGGGVQQALSVALTPNFADISITSLPPDAAVQVDGEQLGNTPLTAQIEAGRHEIVISRPGYKSWREPLIVVANEAQTLPEVTLRRADGRASIASTPPGAVVTIDGKFRGNTPLSLPLAPGRGYSVRLKKAGYADLTRTLSVVPDRDAEMHVDLQPLYGEIVVTTEPADAQVFVAGELLQTGGGTLRLQALPTVIEVRSPGFAADRKTVTPRPAGQQALNFKLLTELEALLATLPQKITTKGGAELLLVPAGRLRLGSSRREQGHRANEVQREATLALPFYLAKNEVTNSEFRRYKTAHNSGSVYHVSLDDGDAPVVNVTWEEAARYCNWLSEQEGLAPAYEDVNGSLVARANPGTAYRLPTEVEWVWAARYSGDPAGSQRFAWGDAMPPPAGTANFAGAKAAGLANPVMRDYEDGYAATAPVGSFAANELGLHDLAGNVAEWVDDFYSFNPTNIEVPSLVQDLHVIRGSSWMHGGLGKLRWAYRDYGDEPRPDLGFRIARSVN